MSEDVVNIVVDGVPVTARKGQMIMQATDPADIYIPRFCYHEKLTVAANCRMCLVEVEKAPKPMPACATPVAEGMKIFTRSPKAISAQKATMEFLLINHPLDCPICDQGGECELQDLAMGYGRDISRYAERKRVVKDKNLGPLISTDMTRCIQCTRCVRFGQEIQGFPQLGTTGRGENMEITTYVEQAVDHELSGNIIDLCPVGALNNKAFRYRARAWEMSQHALISPHDAVGSNLYGHVLRGKLMRIVPRPNEAINETWIADRDRFGFEGMYAEDRILQPMLRIDGALQSVEWETALAAAADGLQKVKASSGAAAIGFLAAPSGTIEEFFLLNRLARGLGTDNIDHRLRQLDFRGQDTDAAFPALGLPLAEVEKLNGLLIVGCDLRAEVPLLAHRVRKAVVRNGARVAFMNPRIHDYLFPVAQQLRAARDLPAQFAALVAAAAQFTGQAIPEGVPPAGIEDAHRAIVAALTGGERRAIFLGGLARRHPEYARLAELGTHLARLTGATLGSITEGANAAGAYLAGAVPHRAAGGAALTPAGLNARTMREGLLKAFVLFGGIEPAEDLAGDSGALARSEFIISMASHLSEADTRLAHVVLPIGTFAETSGTFVNLEGRWQSWAGAAKPVGESRPGWKVLRVLGNLLGLADFDYASSEDVRAAVAAVCGEPSAASRGVQDVHEPLSGGAAAGEWIDVPMYRGDALLRRSATLARTAAGRCAPQVL